MRRLNPFVWLGGNEKRSQCDRFRLTPRCACSINSVDVLQVDLYDEEARGPVLDTPEFYQGCFDYLSADGIMTTNVFGDFSNYDINLQAMAQVFDAVVWLPEVQDANIVVLAFKRAPVIDFSVLYQRAAEIRQQLNLPAKTGSMA
jgi:spermidine synthase